jgi:SAM-dependent methyltransferase
MKKTTWTESMSEMIRQGKHKQHQEMKKTTCLRHNARYPCIVCDNPSTEFFAVVDGNCYRRCTACRAIFLIPEQRLPINEEHVCYYHHRNDPADLAYRRFLSKLADPLLARLGPRSKGLDYGCGPGPALAAMLQEAGHRVNLFDPLFFPDPEPLRKAYDFITCTETIEHFHRPSEEFARLDRMLKPGGWLAIMTCFQTDDAAFASWHYRRDPTHVVFYRAATLRHVAHGYGWSCEFPVKDVALMRKPDHTDVTDKEYQ